MIIYSLLPYLKKYLREIISDDKKYEVVVFNTGLIF